MKPVESDGKNVEAAAGSSLLFLAMGLASFEAASCFDFDGPATGALLFEVAGVVFMGSSLGAMDVRAS